jgi:hypothetical protein
MTPETAEENAFWNNLNETIGKITLRLPEEDGIAYEKLRRSIDLQRENIAKIEKRMANVCFCNSGNPTNCSGGQ